MGDVSESAEARAAKAESTRRGGMSNILYDEDVMPVVAIILKKGRPARAAAPYWSAKAVEVLSLGAGDLDLHKRPYL